MFTGIDPINDNSDSVEAVLRISHGVSSREILGDLTAHRMTRREQRVQMRLVEFQWNVVGVPHIVQPPGQCLNERILGLLSIAWKPKAPHRHGPPI
jgi:hypothetical protein